jgi:H/ACA ribonucleoprotein complex subunit 4
MVSGVLPITLEDATKATRAFLFSGKEYVCLMQLHDEVKENKLRKVIKEFIGEIYQRPPLRASVKRVLRKRTIYDIDIIEIEDRLALFKVTCESGTYIRKLCSDIGDVLGCGAHMRELRRTRAGPFSESEGITTLYDLLDATTTYKEKGDEDNLRKAVFPVEKAFDHMPKIYVKDSTVDSICHGAGLAAPGIVKLTSGIEKGQIIALFTLKEEVIAIAEALESSEGMVEKESGLMAKTDRVIMLAGTYPKMWGKNNS